MKISKKKQLISLINSNLLKFQTYNQNESCFSTIKSRNINFEVKQALKVIYSYHKKKKRILFIGFSYNKFMLNQVNHSFISKKLYSKKFVLSRNKVPNNYDLLVFNNLTVKDKIILKYVKSLNLPSIIFGLFDSNFYSVDVVFKTEKIKFFFSYLIFSILIKSKKQ